MKSFVLLALVGTALAAADFKEYCKPKADPGPCDAYIPRWAFNVTSGQCEKFIYGGCGGNKNNYKTIQECEVTCLRVRISSEVASEEEWSAAIKDLPLKDRAAISPICLLPPVRGPCRAGIPRYFYNATSRTCEKFLYGGCKGNANNFQTIQHCQGNCSSEAEIAVNAASRESLSQAWENVACIPKPDPGPCHGFFPRYYFDKNSTTCKEFIYGGCQGNRNNFDSKELCEYSCDPKTDYQRMCLSRPETGPCRAHMVLWAYNVVKQQCEEFVYGGCDGSDNKYPSRQECEKNCNRPQNSTLLQMQEPVIYAAAADFEVYCKPKADPGPCRAFMPRWAFNVTTGQCERFIYGGCDGNKNNYKTIKKCEATCLRRKVFIEAAAEDLDDFSAAIRYRPPQGRAGVVPIPICQLPPVPGPCRAYMPRYYYNATSRSCEKFVYGGCLGNQNNFETLEQCQRNCSSEAEAAAYAASMQSVSKEWINYACFRKPDRGPCKGNFSRYYFDNESRTCNEFIYGGCPGNNNNFDTKELCEYSCDPKTDYQSECLSRPETGPCMAYFSVWAYNILTRQCEQFVYGGCDGSGNKHFSRQECEEKCHRPQNSTTLHTKEPVIYAVRADFEEYCKPKADPGPCEAYIRRWAFNVSTGQCEEFIYGGCRGNKNNYKTIRACEVTCLRRRDSPELTHLPSMNLDSEPQPSNPICYQPKKVGPCRAHVPRYFYNQTTKYCELFVYGGCKGNENNFETIESCLETCKVGYVGLQATSKMLDSEYAPKNEICRLRADPGPCLEFLPRFYYDIDAGYCRPFKYGGCEGNRNNFLFYDECQAECANTTELEYAPSINLTSEPQVGYVGVQATSKLMSEDEIEGRKYGPKIQLGSRQKSLNMVCYLPKKEGPCRDGIPRYFYNQTTKYCENFIYGGCRGNDNNFKKLESCLKTCKPDGLTSIPTTRLVSEPVPTNPVCYLPKDKGPCRASIPRYFYNHKIRYCEEFTYGGCEGNENNFETSETCLKTCKVGYPETTVNSNLLGKVNSIDSANRVTLRQSVLLDPVCLQPNFTGPCDGYFPRHYYNYTKNICEQFIYGGCQANGNNFETMEACMDKCIESLESKTSDVTQAFDLPSWPLSKPVECTYPVDQGPCDAVMTRYFYNTLTKTCEEFLYGGCGGNANNFRTYPECDKKCKKFMGIIPRI